MPLHVAVCFPTAIKHHLHTDVPCMQHVRALFPLCTFWPYTGACSRLLLLCRRKQLRMSSLPAATGRVWTTTLSLELSLQLPQQAAWWL